MRTFTTLAFGSLAIAGCSTIGGGLRSQPECPNDRIAIVTNNSNTNVEVVSNSRPGTLGVVAPGMREEFLLSAGGSVYVRYERAPNRSSRPRPAAQLVTTRYTCR